MPSKYAQDRRDRDRSNNYDVPLQPYVLTAAETPYKVNHAVAPRTTYQQHPKGSSSSTTAVSNSNFRGSYPPYRQRLVAAALGTTDDPHSSNDSSSAPSSNTTAISSGTSSSSPTTSKGKVKSIGPVPVPTVPQPVPASLCIPIPHPEPAGFDRSTSYYEFLMAHNAGALPAPGPSHFERRRALWTASPPTPPAPASPSPSRIKLEALLGHPGAVESEEVWRVGLKNVWKGLLGGNQLRHRLPLEIVLKILQAGWLRDGTWPEGMAAPAWDQPMQTPPPAPPPDSSRPQSQSQPQPTQQQHERERQRRVHEQEAYAAALHARASAEQGSGAAQIMHMQAYAMMGMGLGGGIPLGYSPSSGDAPEEGYYTVPYAYAEPTPPGSDGAPAEGDRVREGEEGPPPTPAYAVQDLQSEMDTDDEEEEEDRVEDDGRMEGIVQTGDGRHEGG